MCVSGLLCDLLWSDPDKDVQGWGENDRGVSFTFGADVVSKFLNRHDLDLICRAHQVIKPASEGERVSQNAGGSGSMLELVGFCHHEADLHLWFK